MHADRINEDSGVDTHGESEERDNANCLQQTISQTLSTNSVMTTATLESRDLSMASLNSLQTHWALEGLGKKFTNIEEAYLHVALWKQLFEDEARAETERQAETAHRASSRETHENTKKKKKKKTKKKRYSVSKNKDKRSIEDSDGYETTLATWNQGNSGFDWLFTSEEWCIKLQSAQLNSMKVRYRHTPFVFTLC
jgi:hypothetical protein